MKKPNLSCQNFVLIGLVVLSFLLFSRLAQATNIEKLFNELQLGQRVQIKVSKASSGQLVADRIQLDKGESKPKIRSTIQSVNKDKKSIKILGLEIQVTEGTETDLKKNVKIVEVLKPGQRVEVKFKLKTDSGFKATRIKTKNVKTSDKIEAVIQEKISGDKNHFYIKLLGLKIKINSGTDVLEEISESYSPLEKRLVDIDETRAIKQIKLWDFLIVEGGIEGNLTPQRNYQSYQPSNGLNGLNAHLVSTGILIDKEGS